MKNAPMHKPLGEQEKIMEKAMNRTTTVGGLLILCLLLTAALAGPASARYRYEDYKPDEENCLLCHKYPANGRVEVETGRIRYFYVNSKLFNNTVHGKIRCRNCHQGILQIPHDNPPKVDCSTECHLKEPSTGKPFSHKTIVEGFQESVHGVTNPDGTPKKFARDLPHCTDCHVNPEYMGIASLSNLDQIGIAEESVRRCKACHENAEWAERFYQHVSHRLRTRSRSAEAIVELCLRCHKDEERMRRHNKPATANYKDMYHWKMVLFKDQNAPDCLSCHAPAGYSVHTLKPKENPDSPVNDINKLRTCANVGGTQECHPSPTRQFAKGRVHTSGLGLEEMVVDVMGGETKTDIAVLAKEKRFKTLLIQEESSLISDKDRFEARIIGILRLIYKLLITGTIGGMASHQALDLFATLRNLGKHHH